MGKGGSRYHRRYSADEISEIRLRHYCGEPKKSIARAIPCSVGAVHYYVRPGYAAILREKARQWRMANPEKARAATQRWSAAHPGHKAAAARLWNKHNRERANARRRKEQAAGKRKQIDIRKTLKFKYGLAWDQYQEIVQRQNGLCVICQSPPPTGRRLVVDHDHDTGMLRELLCHNCNSMIGLAKDRIEVLARAARYLIRHRKGDSHREGRL